MQINRTNTDLRELKRAAQAIKEAGVLLIASGAGMGVDSGLAPFRGPQGLWSGNSPYKKLNIDMQSLANPALFITDPALAWGFYGYRLATYRTAQPYKGFKVLKGWSNQKRVRAFFGQFRGLTKFPWSVNYTPSLVY